MSQTQTHSISFFLHPSSSEAAKHSTHPTALVSSNYVQKTNFIYLQVSPNEVLRDLFGLKLYKTRVLTSPGRK